MTGFVLNISKQINLYFSYVIFCIAALVLLTSIVILFCKKRIADKNPSLFYEEAAALGLSDPLEQLRLLVDSQVVENPQPNERRKTEKALLNAGAGLSDFLRDNWEILV